LNNRMQLETVNEAVEFLKWFRLSTGVYTEHITN
jgi:hypothetical protein